MLDGLQQMTVVLEQNLLKRTEHTTLNRNQKPETSKIHKQ